MSDEDAMSRLTVEERRRGLLEMRLFDNRTRHIWWKCANLLSTPRWVEYPLETHRPQDRRARFWRWLLGG